MIVIVRYVNSILDGISEIEEEDRENDQSMPIVLLITQTDLSRQQRHHRTPQRIIG